MQQILPRDEDLRDEDLGGLHGGENEIGDQNPWDLVWLA